MKFFTPSLILNRSAHDPAPSGDSADYTAFIARTSGLDATHLSAYQALINGLVSDFGGALSTKLDALYICCTQDETTAKLNLVQNIYNLTETGTVNFTADQGFTCSAGGSNAHYLNSNFNPATATSPNFTLNNAHISAWSNAAGGAASANSSMGSDNWGTSAATYIDMRYTADLQYYRINDNSSAASAGISGTDTDGYRVACRSASNAQKGYKSSGGAMVDQSVVSANSGTAVTNANILIMNIWVNGAVGSGSETRQHSAFSIGRNLSATEVGYMYTRIGAFRTAVGL